MPSVFHVPENQPPIQVAVATARLSGGLSLVVSNWPGTWTAFPKILVVRRVGLLVTALEATGISGATLTISGPIDGYADAAQSIGDTIEVDPTALSITELQTAIRAVGLPAGGTTAQVLAKIDSTDYRTQWVDQTGGGGVTERDAFLVYQDFSGYADGALTTTQTGQSWIQNTIGGATATAAIAGGTMGVTSFGAASYPTVDLGSGIKPAIVWASWFFDATGTTGSAPCFLISPDNPIDLSNINGLVHLVYGDTVWSFGIYNGNALSFIDNGGYVAPLVCDGVTTYTGGIQIRGNTAILYLPDGTTRTYTDTRIGTFNGRYATFELFIPVSTHNFRYTRIAVESRTPSIQPLPHSSIDDLWRMSGAVIQDATALASARAGTSANTFTGRQTITAAGTDYQLQCGTSFGLETLGPNLSLLADNLYDDGSGWKYKANGTGQMLFFSSGGLSYYTAPSNSSGAGASATITQVLSFNSAGDITATGGGLTGLNPANLAGTPAAITGSKAGNAALASMITHLVAAFPNLFSDGTS